MYEDYESPVVTKAKAVWATVSAHAVRLYGVVSRQVVDAFNKAREGEVHKDRDVQIAAGIVVASILFTSTVLFGAALGYVGYHYFRRDDHVRAAVEALSDSNAAK